MIRFTIYTYLFKPINEPQEPDMFSPEVKVDESLAMKQELLGELFKAESKGFQGHVIMTLRDWHLPCNNKAPFYFGRVLHITNTTKGEITLQL